MLGRKEQDRGSKSNGREKEPIVDQVVGKPLVLMTLKQSREGQGRGQDMWRGGRAFQAEKPEQTRAMGWGQHGALEEGHTE